MSQSMALPHDTTPDRLVSQSRLVTVPLSVRSPLGFPTPTWQSSAPEAGEEIAQIQTGVKTWGDR